MSRPAILSAPIRETALNADNKVSLYTNVNGNVRLFNKNSGD